MATFEISQTIQFCEYSSKMAGNGSDNLAKEGFKTISFRLPYFNYCRTGLNIYSTVGLLNSHFECIFILYRVADNFRNFNT